MPAVAGNHSPAEPVQASPDRGRHDHQRATCGECDGGPAAGPTSLSGPNPAAYPATVFAVALVLRGISLALFFRTPYALFPVLDARRYYEWALEILAGTPAPGPFLYEPLYTYLQVAIYALTGIDFHHLLIFQALAGSVGVVLAYFILLEHLPSRWSLAGALVYAAYPVSLFADTLPIKEPLSTVLLLAAILQLQRHLRSGRTSQLFIAGLFFGLMLLVRENLLALVPFFILLLLVVAKSAAAALRLTCVLLSGVAFAVLPVTARNCLGGGDCVLIAASGGSNLYMAFNERARGDSFVQPSFAVRGPAHLTEDSIVEAGRLAGRPLSPSAASRFWAREALQYVAENPARCVGLLAERLWTSLGNDEISSVYPYEYLAQVNPLIGLNPLGFGLILSFGAVGWWCARAERGTLIFPAIFLGTWISFLPFWTLDRFRLPAVLPLIAGALFAIREIRQRLRERDVRRAGALLLFVVLLLAIALPHRVDARRREEVIGLAYARGADLYLQQGDLARAGAYLDRARRGPQTLLEVNLVAARYYAAVGRPDDALRELAAFRAWRRDLEDAELLQARLLAARGDQTAARGILEEYLAAWPGSARARRALEGLRASGP